MVPMTMKYGTECASGAWSGGSAGGAGLARAEEAFDAVRCAGYRQVMERQDQKHRRGSVATQMPPQLEAKLPNASNQRSVQLAKTRVAASRARSLVSPARNQPFHETAGSRRTDRHHHHAEHMNHGVGAPAPDGV